MLFFKISGYNRSMSAIILLVLTYIFSIFNRLLTGFLYTMGFILAMEVIGGLLK